jgi:hypothetical protein
MEDIRTILSTWSCRRQQEHEGWAYGVHMVVVYGMILIIVYVVSVIYWSQ